MKIVIVGTGYVGLVSGTCFADVGNEVTCVDVNRAKIKQLCAGVSPIYEPNLEAVIERNITAGNLHFSTSLKDAIVNAEIVFIAVGTPMGEDGSSDLKYVLEVAHEIGLLMRQNLIIVNKSTCPVGTFAKIKATITETLEKRNVSYEFDLISNPEFLREGNAVEDFTNPDRIVIGSENETATKKMRSLYRAFFKDEAQFISMSIKAAEMTKYVANAMLATKISFINEMANICEVTGADIKDVCKGIGADHRIGHHFINAGIGYGGSCFPKDVKALYRFAKKTGYEPSLIKTVEKVNKKQRELFFKKITRRFSENLIGKTFVFWGLAFKPNTDDMREAPAIDLAKFITVAGGRINAYDPKAINEAKKYYLKNVKNINYFDEKYEGLKNTDALILLTEWDEFKTADFGVVKELLKSPILFDARNLYSKQNLCDIGFEYYGIGTNSTK